MAVTILAYNCLRSNLAKGFYALDTDTIKVGLMTNSHTFNSATQVAWSDVSTNEVSGDGYTAGGKALTGLSVSTGPLVAWDADDVTWTGLTLSTWHGVVYDTTASNKLIASINFGGEQAIAAGIFKITWNVSGVMTLA